MGVTINEHIPSEYPCNLVDITSSAMITIGKLRWAEGQVVRDEKVSFTHQDKCNARKRYNIFKYKNPQRTAHRIIRE